MKRQQASTGSYIFPPILNRTSHFLHAYKVVAPGGAFYRDILSYLENNIIGTHSQSVTIDLLARAELQANSSTHHSIHILLFVLL